MNPLLLALFFAAASPTEPGSAKIQTGGELRFSAPSDPKTLHPLMVSDDTSDLVRHLISGSLVRLNRVTQKIEPELAESWKVTGHGAQITFQLRKGLRFADGTPFDSADVVFTVQKLMDKNLISPAAESFRPAGGAVTANASGPSTVSVRFPESSAGMERLFAGLSILSSRSPKKEATGLGPFMVGDSKAGVYLRLVRNANYWRKDSAGRQLPYLDSIRIEFQKNRDIELLRFQKGEFDLISNIEPEAFEKLKANPAVTSFDLGVSLDTQQIWFNQTPTA